VKGREGCGRRSSVAAGPHRGDRCQPELIEIRSATWRERVRIALAVGRTVGWLSVLHPLRVMSRKVSDTMKVALSRRWSVVAVLVALSVTTASSAVAAVSSATTVKKTAPVTVVKKPAKATALRIAAAHSTVTAKGKFQDTITGTLTAAKVPLAGQKVVLQERKVGAKTWLVGSSKVTGKKGSVSFVVTQANTREQYELVFAAHSGFAASHSAIVTIVKK